jgi:putative toxin of predicted polymorphic toxin system
MAIPQQLKRYAGRRLTRRLTRSLPWVGGAVALLTLGGAMRRKGVLGGAVHTVLDFIPFVGGVKNLAEAARGRDFVPDKPRIRPDTDTTGLKS